MNKIAFVTDLHLDEQFPIDQGVDARANWKRVLADIKSRDISEIILGGDVGTNDSYQWIFDSLTDYRVTVTAGNHDDCQALKRYISPEFSPTEGGLCYSFDKDGFRWVYFDSSTESVSENQADWLQDKLSSDLPVILLIHHPVFPVRSAIDNQYFLRGRETLQEILKQSGVRVFIFSGHYHLADEQTLSNITQIITPAVSYQVIKDADPIAISTDTFAYRIITIDTTRLSSEIIEFTS
ncbi:MAG: metallophosphoesterase [Cyclobacteriaceae bacterium]